MIDKDSELHPLVRWQFQGGLAEEQRRAFLFTNVVDGSGRRYDIPVAVGALGASPAIYAVGMGKPVDDIGDAWTRAIAAPIPPVVVSTGACQEVVTRGSDLLRAGEGLARLPIPVSTPGFDSAPYLTATLCVTRDPESGVQNMGTYRGALKAQDRLGVRMSSRPGGRAATCIGENIKTKRTDALCHRHRLRARGSFYWTTEVPSTRMRWPWREDLPAVQFVLSRQ